MFLDTTDPFKLIATEVVIVALKDYSKGLNTRDEMMDWMDNELSYFSLWADCLGVNIRKLRSYIIMEMNEIDGGKKFTTVLLID